MQEEKIGNSSKSNSPRPYLHRKKIISLGLFIIVLGVIAFFLGTQQESQIQNNSNNETDTVELPTDYNVLEADNSFGDINVNDNAAVGEIRYHQDLLNEVSEADLRELKAVSEQVR
jgi:hypothetical protein